MVNYKLTISYDGSRYLGFQNQTQFENTIAGKIEEALMKLSGEDVHLIGAGRTDAGVHALAMPANVYLKKHYDTNELLIKLNELLPEDIRITNVLIVPKNFHARYSACGKTYRYTCYFGEEKPVFKRKYVHVLNKQPDIEAMKAAAAILIGEHDFRSFCKITEDISTVRTVDKIDICKEGDYLYLTYHGNGFLRYMVRIITGTLLDVGMGKRSASSVKGILDAKDRTLAGPTAPACGLMMIKSDYMPSTDS